MQLLPIEVIRAHFWRSLLLLQQSPPIDQLVMKAAQLAPWPYGVAYVLCMFNGVLTIATSCLIYYIIVRIAGSRILAFGVACWFMLSTDTLVLEYALFGQMFYEFLGMFGGAVICALLISMDGKTERRACTLAAFAGIATALTALSRSSFCYLAFLLTVYGIVCWRRRCILSFLLPVLLLQGGWAAKNALIYGTFSLETSSWGGLNAERGFVWAGQQTQLCQEIVGGKLGSYPDWFVRMNRDCPIPFSDNSDSYVPDDVRQRDKAFAASLAGQPLPWNTVALQLKALWYRHAILRFSVAHPALMWDRFAIGYGLFWQRIADFGALLFDPLFVVPVDRSLFTVSGRGLGEKQRVMLTIAPDRKPASISTAFWTISLAPLDAISLATLHVLFPVLIGLDFFGRNRDREGLLASGAAVPAIITVYGLVMFSAFDVGENMRFRLSVEPEILALTAVSLLAALRRIGGALGPVTWRSMSRRQTAE